MVANLNEEGQGPSDHVHQLVLPEGRAAVCASGQCQCTCSTVGLGACSVHLLAGVQTVISVILPTCMPVPPSSLTMYILNEVTLHT